MSLTVGIHENIVLSKAEKNERGSLVITFKQAAVSNPLATLNSGAVSSGFSSREQDFLIYPPKVENMQNEIDTPDNIIKKISQVIDPLTHILQQYMTKDKIKWNITEGLDIDDTNFNTKITSATVISKIYDNIVNQFIAMAKPCIESQEKMRLLLIRQSTAKHFPALRRMYLETNPFIERMSVPASRLRYTTYEINNGYDNPNPVGGTQSVSTSEAKQAQDIFN